MIQSLGDYHSTDPSDFEKTGALDPILGIDTRLFIDPSLIKHTRIAELSGCTGKIENYFSDVLRIIKQIAKESDIFWRRADKLLTFPEVHGLCIGYSSHSTSGKGTGPQKRHRLLDSLMQLTQAGCNDHRIFDLVGAFEDGIGPDLISDMIAKIIIDDLICYTQHVCSDLAIPMMPLPYSRSFPPEDLPFDPTTNRPIILVPKEILRDLPVAETFADIAWISAHNEKVRENLNKLVAGSYRSMTASERKEQVKMTFIEHPDVLAQVLKAYDDVGAKFYDFADDPAGETIWYQISRKLPKSHALSLTLANNPTPSQVYEVVEKICTHFKKLVEDNQLCNLLYDKHGQKKHESAAQLLFFGIASAYCGANNLDLSPESDAGRGPVDFKVSSGLAGKVLVEIKLTSNQKLAHGFETQLPIYQAAEGTQKGIYLVINNGGITESRWSAFSDLVAGSGKHAPRVIVVDGIKRQSASKASD